MIDLHCHMLPGIDDGAPDMETSLAMARMAVADGITELACTPHIFPGLYENTAASIREHTEKFRSAINEAGIPLKITYAADVQIMPELIARLQAGTIPTFNGGRYFLFEPTHRVAPPNFETLVFRVQAAGYMPIITHPERLDWVDEHYAVFKKMALSGIWMQITAGSLKGKFGKKAKYWGERMLNDGLVHMLATDAHNLGRRSPKLMEGYEAARYWVGDKEAQRLVKDRPKAVLDNISPDDVFPIPALIGAGSSNKGFKFKYDTIRRYFYFLNKP